MTGGADEALDRLKRGNHSFIECHGHMLARHLSGQRPFAAVLSCADSRVVPEKIFNAGIGDIFVVRAAGNLAVDPTILGSLDYAVEHLDVPLIVVLGHTCCGAVGAAASEPEAKANMGHIVSEIRCALDEHGEGTRANVLRQCSMLAKRSQVIEDAVMAGRLKVIGAVYHMETGEVEWL